MSNSAQNHVDDGVEPDLPPGPYFVLSRIADHATDHSGEDWTCFPSVEVLMRRTHFSRASVERHLAFLVAEGWISRKRRVRPDGRLGIYDYTLHRRAEHRAALKAARSGVPAVDNAPSEGAEPHVNLQHGPCVNLEPTMLQIEGKPCRNLQHVEPSVEPSLEPTGAREPGDAGFEKAFAAFAVCGQRRSHMDRSRAAWALWSGRISADLLIAAIVRFTAEDPDLKRGVCKGFEGWLNGEVFRHWLPGVGGQAVGDGEAMDPRTRFAGPVELFDQLVAAGASPALLGFSGWDAESREIRTRTATAAKKLEDAISIPVCRALNIKFVKAADQAAGGNA